MTTQQLRPELLTAEEESERGQSAMLHLEALDKGRRCAEIHQRAYDARVHEWIRIRAMRFRLAKR